MAFTFQNQLDDAAQRRSRAYFATLCEKDQRRFAVLEAQRLGHGGIISIVKLLGVSRSTIERGIREYDIRRNVGHINIGLSHYTSEFAADSLSWYWNRIGKQCYAGATSILLLCDCGGSNAANRYLFKYYLQQWSDSIGIPIRVAHLPSYCSKYNPIERRFFSHVGRACAGRLFDSLETVVDLMRQTSTRTGLRATVNVIRRAYETGQKLAEELKSELRIVYDEALPKWNYTTKLWTQHLLITRR